MRNSIKHLLNQFLQITALIFIGLGLSFLISKPVLTYKFIIEVVLVGFLSTIPTVLFLIPKLKFILKIIIHYILLNIIVLTSAYLFGYIEGNGIIFLMIFIFIVYVLIWLLEYFVNVQEANDINNALEKIIDEE